ncbi:MAG: family 20 glycosylhydrolase [bacterium]
MRTKTTKIDRGTLQEPEELKGLLNILKGCPVRDRSGGNVQIHFERATGAGLCEVERHGTAAVVRYSTPAQAGRALGALKAGLVPPHGVYRETTPFETLGIMLDCSRNAVMTVEHVTGVWLPRLVLLGYNQVMLYTEDTYELPGEPYFGYQRGAYTAAELTAIVAAAAALNIEVVPCIQTLGHLEQILRHGAYGPVRDTSSVLMVGEPKTYELIDKMVAHWAGIIRTRRIHIGMDETHDLGRGRYMDQHGYRNGFDLFNEHLKKVTAICLKYGLKPMIWSDMYFRLGSKTGDYYDPKAVIPPRVAKQIPLDVDLVYWDYYHDDPAFYLDWIERHRKLGKEPLMGSGVWTWNMHWHHRRLTEANAGACVRACYQAKLKEVLFTMWGDNGAFCDHDSAFAGLAYCADLAYGATTPSPARLEKRFAAVCGGSYAAHQLASDLYMTHHQGDTFQGPWPSLWDDPFGETGFRTWAKDDPRQMAKAVRHYTQLANKLRPLSGDRACGDLGYAHAVARLIAERYSLCADLMAAYQRRNRPGLQAVRRRIPRVLTALRDLEKTFRRMWLSHNKPEGMAATQGRFGWIDVRYREMDQSLAEFLAGKRATLAELEYRCPPV